MPFTPNIRRNLNRPLTYKEMDDNFEGLYDLVTGATGLDTSVSHTFTASQIGAFSSISDSTLLALDFETSNNFNIVLTTGTTILDLPLNLVAGQSGVINTRQDLSGARALAFAWCWEFPNGSAPSPSGGSYALDQFVYMVNAANLSTVTISNANPCVITWTGHTLVSGMKVRFDTIGTLPASITTGTTYWVTVVDVDTFNISTSLSDAILGTYVDTSLDSNSGTHYCLNASITITLANPDIS